MDTNNMILNEISKIKIELASKASATQVSVLQKHMRACLGNVLQNISAGWLKKLIISKGSADPRIIENFKFKNTVTGEEREIDVICMDPLFILECTSFLDSNEFKKLERFNETRYLVENHFKKKCEEVFFISYEIDDEIEEKSLQFMSQHGITYINDPYTK